MRELMLVTHFIGLAYEEIEKISVFVSMGVAINLYNCHTYTRNSKLSLNNFGEILGGARLEGILKN